MYKYLFHTFIVFIIVLNSQRVLGYIVDDTNSECNFDGISKNGFFYNQIINDTFRGNLKTFKIKNVQNVRVKKNKYLGAKTNKDITELTIFTKRSMQNYDRNEISNTTILRINFYCRNNITRTIKFIQAIQDINNNKPRFSKQKYIFELQMPWPKLMDLTLIENITVTDLDFSNREIQFDIIPNDYFTIELKTRNLVDKTYQAAIKLKQDVMLISPLESDIFATDERDAYGNQHIKERATIIIIPLFEKNIRYFNYIDYDETNTTVSAPGILYYEDATNSILSLHNFKNALLFLTLSVSSMIHLLY